MRKISPREKGRVPGFRASNPLDTVTVNQYIHTIARNLSSSQSMPLSVLQFDHHSFAVFQRDGEFALAQRQRVVAEHFGAPAVQRRDAFVFVRRQFFDVLGIGDQARRHARRLRRAAAAGS